MMRDAIQLNQPIHSPPQVRGFAPLRHVQKEFSHQDPLKPASPGHGCSPPRPLPPSSLYPCYTSCTVQCQTLTSTSGRQPAELNQCQARGLRQHFSIRNLLSWQQQVSAVVWFSCTNPSARSGQDSEEPLAGQGAVLATGRGACGVPAAPG